MQLTVPHTFSQQEATERIKHMLSEIRTKFGDKVTLEKEEWQGNTLHFAFSAEGKSFDGHVEILEKVFDIEIKLPLLMRPFEGLIRKQIEQQMAQMSRL